VSEFVLRFRQDEVFASPHQYLAICLTSKPLAF
jgi:hypothetical protein